VQDEARSVIGGPTDIKGVSAMLKTILNQMSAMNSRAIRPAPAFAHAHDYASLRVQGAVVGLLTLFTALPISYLAVTQPAGLAQAATLLAA
jgi:hypothetical protein